MKKITLLVILSTALVSNTVMAKDACATILCLGGSMLKGKGASVLMCKSPIQDYFDVKKNEHGHFSRSRTLKARIKYLNQCSSTDNESDKSRINSTFGTVRNNPGTFY